MSNKHVKSWVVFYTRCGSFVSNRKMTRDEALNIWNSAHISQDFFDVFGLLYQENFITGVASSETWTRKDAEEHAKDHDRKLLDELLHYVENMED